ncbi:MAG: hypothetical protein ACU4EQ_01800 [Candidatus Nitrosoglobus sp.]|jgi:hypothetical protein
MKHKYLKQNFLAETDLSDLTLAEVQKPMLRTKVDKREKDRWLFLDSEKTSRPRPKVVED